MKPEKNLAAAPPPASNFVRNIIDEDLRTGKWDGRVETRFPPEPNGYLHYGHAKSICLNFGLAEAYGGVCHMRFDDTNPEKEEQEYVDAILEAVKWLGFDWGEHLYFASDYFDTMYACALSLISAGKAYVDSQSADDMRARRGTLTEPGKDSPHRERSVEENLDLFSRMRAGEFPEGTHILRAKIDMASANINMRDPAIYRIRHVAHHRAGDKWPIYPMYTYAHPIEDAIENITHSVCTLEFEDQRPFYDWLLDALADAGHYPAIDIEQSISRAMHNLVGDDHFNVVRQFKQFFSRYQRSRDLIAVGAYQPGGDPLLDMAVKLYPRLEAFLQQGISEHETYDGALQKLAQVFS